MRDYIYCMLLLIFWMVNLLLSGGVIDLLELLFVLNTETKIWLFISVWLWLTLCSTTMININFKKRTE